MNLDAEVHDFFSQLVAWRVRTLRPLPWRASLSEVPDPYKILLSEFMLQQTQVKTVIPYFNTFLLRWPTIHHLAAEALETLMIAWQGLGYYIRCEWLHSAAQRISQEGWPHTQKEWNTYRGIGPYMAAALVSLMNDENALACDGNTLRVLSRWNASTRRELLVWINSYMIKDHLNQVSSPRYLTEALIDLGATICKHHVPECHACPVKLTCKSYENHTQYLFPDRLPKTKVETIYIHIFWGAHKGMLPVVKRHKNQPLAHTYSCPEEIFIYEDDDNNHDKKNKIFSLERNTPSHYPFGSKNEWECIPNPIIHKLTHRKWIGFVWVYKGSECIAYDQKKMMSLNTWNQWPLSRWMEKIRSHVKLINQ